MARRLRPLAVVTGASTGIGYELAKCCAKDGFDLMIAADEPEIKSAASDFEQLGVRVEAVEADLSTLEAMLSRRGATTLKFGKFQTETLPVAGAPSGARANQGYVGIEGIPSAATGRVADS